MPQRLIDRFAAAAALFRSVWRQLLVTSVLFKVVAFAVLAPLAGLLLRFIVSTSGGAAVADEEILFFLLSPVGVAGLLLFAGFSLAIIGLQQAALMAVSLAAAQGRSAEPWSALRFALSRWRSVLALTARITCLALLIAAPFLAVGGAVYLWLLTEFDINYYLSARPPAFWLAVLLIGAVLLSLAAVLVSRAVGWLVSLPTLMFERVSARQALQRASARVRGRRREAAEMLVVWGGIAVLLSSASTALIVGISRMMTPWAGGSTRALLLFAAIVVLAWFIAGQLVSFFNGAAFALLVTDFYRSVAATDAAGDASRIADIRTTGGMRLSRGAIVAGVMVACGAGLGLGWLALRGLSGDSDVQVIAHRGAAMWAPENTLASVQRALDDHADWVEIDVQETADGRVVVVHDSDFMKLAGVPTRVWEATYDEIRGIDIGTPFGANFAGEIAPTLREVLLRARETAGVTIELKYYGHDQMLEQRVIDIVEELGMEGQIVIMSLVYEGIQKVRALRPEWTVGILSAVAIGDLTRLDADFLAVNTGLGSRALLRDAHAAGKDVYVWTVNDPITAYAMISRGVDGIITDDPAMGVRMRAAYNDLDAVQRLVLEVALLIGAIDLEDAEPEEIG